MTLAYYVSINLDKNMKKTYREIAILNDQYKVVVVIGTDREIRRCLVHYGYPKDIDLGLEVVMGMTYNRFESHPVIALPRFPKSAEDYGTLAHEAVHAVKYIFDHIEEESIDEVFAHCVAAVVRGVLTWRKNM